MNEVSRQMVISDLGNVARFSAQLLLVIIICIGIALPVCANNFAEAQEHYNLAHRYLARLDFQLADCEYEEAICALPRLLRVHRDYGLLCLLRLDFPRAIAEFMIVTGLGEPIPYTPFEKAELDARAAKLHYRKALSYARTSRWPVAVYELKWALTYAPQNPAIIRSLAFAYASAGQFEQAEAWYGQSFDADPNDAYAHADFAFLLLQEGKQERAVSQLKQAVDLQPQVAALHVDLAWLSEKRGDLMHAVSELEEAIKLSPKHAILWVHLGRLEEQQGNVVDANKDYAQALLLDPKCKLPI